MTDVGVILQSLCHLHRWTRSPDDSAIYERPERLQSIRLGIAAIHARLNTQGRSDVKGKQREGTPDLEALLDNLSLKTPNTSIHDGHPFSIATSSRRLPLSSPAVTLAHGQEYIPKLLGYLANVKKAHASQTSEVPADLSQGDLYLCDTTLQALEGALGACCDAVDQVLAAGTSGRKRFVSIRPPGHHCETADPMGFCWLNNVAVAAAHAHLEHGINKVIILDIDLHHGNGTQQIAWRLNQLAHEQIHQTKRSSPRKGSPKKPEPLKPPLQVLYGSLHDVNSYPCEDMDPVLIANASVNISGGGGSQYITNVHLEPYDSLDDFHDSLYPAYRDSLFQAADAFLRKTLAIPEQTLIIVSAGFDACEHEYPAMSRHGAKVPVSFFTRFAQDASALSEKHALGRMLAVLEGGYSQTALSTGVGAFLHGLAEPSADYRTVTWWNLENIEAYEKLVSVNNAKSRNGIHSIKQETTDEIWHSRAKEMFQILEDASPDFIKPSPPTARPLKPIKAKVIEPVTNSRALRSQGAASTQTSPDKPTKDRASKNASSVFPNAPVFGQVSHPTSTIPVLPVHSSAESIPVATPAELKSTPLIRFTFKAGEEERLRRENEINGNKKSTTG